MGYYSQTHTGILALRNAPPRGFLVQHVHEEFTDRVGTTGTSVWYGDGVEKGHCGQRSAVLGSHRLHAM